MTNVYEEAKVFLENFVPNESNLDADFQAVAEQEELVLSFPRRDYLLETYPNLSAEEHLHRLSDLIKLHDSLLVGLKRLKHMLENLLLEHIADQLPSCFNGGVDVSAHIELCDGDDEEMYDEDDEEDMKILEERRKPTLSIMDPVKHDDMPPDIFICVEVCHRNFEFTLHIEYYWDDTFSIEVDDWNMPTMNVSKDDFLSVIGVLKINEGAAGLAAGIQKGIDWLNK